MQSSRSKYLEFFGEGDHQSLKFSLTHSVSFLNHRIFILVQFELVIAYYITNDDIFFCFLLTIVTVNIRDRLKASNMKFDRYKFIVQCIIGENKGQGVKYGCRCLWDSDTDGMAEYVYLNESLFCAVAAFGIFYY
jgi:hypothetical protein